MWISGDDCDLDDFRASVERRTDARDYPHALGTEQNVLLYDSDTLRRRTTTPGERRAVRAELARALLDGPGIVVFKGAFEDLSAVDRATVEFDGLIAEQKARGTAAGDHFAAPGANDRVWGALDKLALRRPEVFADYYANDMIALAATAWLGPGYQITSQINVVNPGGQAQVAHRDYHLGFMSGEQAERFPAQAHRLAPALTLQGAVAHCDMPVESGPTLYLPYSQTYEPGYLAFHRPEFTAYFDAHRVQLPLAKGDAAFFNPALFHGAGTNRSRDIRRMANLLQISSAFGRAMESVDRTAMCEALFPVLRKLKSSGAGAGTLARIVAASAEGYAFPTNLDHDQPVGGPAPETQAELIHRALALEWDDETLAGELRARDRRRATADGA
ncbi:MULTISPECIES: phytanoyl-CoA dioxygenase family protein [unclassified Streptomyces]|uniref:phytanoyl-CoA dioxygenase family protein n=2 Tax=Streptomyces TaxID=1883 RepID=UPI00381CFF48